METKYNKINANQLCAILVSVFIAMRPIIRVSIQTGLTGNDAWFPCLIAMLVNSCYAIILCYIAFLNPNKSFYQILCDCVGKIISKILVFILAIYFLFKVVIVDFEFETFLNETLYSEINWEMFIIPIILLFIFLALKGIRPIARSLQFFLPFSIFALIFSLGLSSISWKFTNLLPIFDHSYNQIIKSIYYSLIQSGEFLFVTIIMENILSNEKKFFTKIAGSLTFSSVIVIGFYVLYIAVFGNLAQFVKEGLVQITQFSPSSMPFFKSDSFVSIMWVPIVLLEVALSLYGVAWCFNKIFKLNIKIGIPVLALIIYSIDLFPQVSTVLLEQFYYEKLGPIMFIFEIFVPILVLIISVIKNNKEHSHEKIH